VPADRALYRQVAATCQREYNSLLEQTKRNAVPETALQEPDLAIFRRRARGFSRFVGELYIRDIVIEVIVRAIIEHDLSTVVDTVPASEDDVRPRTCDSL
jgi:hypothetical protein